MHHIFRNRLIRITTLYSCHRNDRSKIQIVQITFWYFKQPHRLCVWCCYIKSDQIWTKSDCYLINLSYVENKCRGLQGYAIFGSLILSIYHMICASLGFLVDFQTFFACEVVFQYFPCPSDDIECHLCTLLVIVILVRMH